MWSLTAHTNCLVYLPSIADTAPVFGASVVVVVVVEAGRGWVGGTRVGAVVSGSVGTG
jgi:hypothetical protein